MTFGAWLTRVLWAGFARWVGRDPARAASRISALLERVVEWAVSSLEVDPPTAPPDPESEVA
jgi:hypothetical protein